MENVPTSEISIDQLFHLKGKLKNWKTIRNEYHLLESKSFQ